jgi:glycine betaine/choline ABC-type transport system substrate-binding protein
MRHHQYRALLIVIAGLVATLALSACGGSSSSKQSISFTGAPECRQRLDCLLGLQQVYHAHFSFKPVAISAFYPSLDSGQTDASEVFTTDGPLASGKYVLLTDDKHLFPPDNVEFVVRDAKLRQAGPDLPRVIALVQQGLTTPAMQELNARVDISKQTPAAVAAAYLRESGYTGTGPNAIKRNPANAGVTINVGSKNFTEEFILGNIYAQALTAAGYNVKTAFNLGSEQIAFQAVKHGTVDAYPEYTGTALTSFFGLTIANVPKDEQAAYQQARAGYAKVGLTALPPSPFTDTNGIAVTKAEAKKLGNITNISQLAAKSG